MLRSSRVRTGSLLRCSILPPTCIWNVRSVISTVHGLADLRRVLLARGLDRDVAQRVAALDRHQVYGADAPSGFADGGGDQAEHAGPVVDLHAEDDRVLRRD